MLTVAVTVVIAFGLLAFTAWVFTEDTTPYPQESIEIEYGGTHLP